MDGESRIADDNYDIVDVGADEVDCTNTWNEIDWTQDGIINMKEFAIFSAAWLSHDPNDPIVTTDPNYSGNPNYIYVTEEILQQWRQSWNPICNLDNTADTNTEYEIDVADFILFCEDYPQNWLWTACWRENYIIYGMNNGGENIMLSTPAFFMSPSTSLESQLVEEKSMEEQILDLEGSIVLLEKIWLEDPSIQKGINPDNWKEFMDSVYERLSEIKTEGVLKQQKLTF